MLHTITDVDLYLAKLPVKVRDYAQRLKDIRSVLRKLKDPQDSISAIHIAGTSGKGSTAYYAAALLHESGFSVGLAVSPHVSSVTERSQVNGAPLPEAEYCENINQFIALLENVGFEASYIEFVDMFTYWLFSKLDLDYMVIEVGLGGRLDPTNVISRADKVCVITDIGFDHTEILGNTLASIASEKAGIITVSNIVVMYEQSNEVMRAVKKATIENNASLTLLQPAIDTTDLHNLPLFQRRNWRLAKAAVEIRLHLDAHSELSASALTRSLNVSIPGRFEVVSKDGVTIILDSAHNPQKMGALVNAIKHTYTNESIIYITSFGINKRQSVAELLRTMKSGARRLITTEFILDASEAHQAISADTIQAIAQQVGYPATESIKNPLQALNTAIKYAQANDAIIVITGSFYLVSNLRELFTKPS